MYSVIARPPLCRTGWSETTQTDRRVEEEDMQPQWSKWINTEMSFDWTARVVPRRKISLLGKQDGPVLTDKSSDCILSLTHGVQIVGRRGHQNLAIYIPKEEAISFVQKSGVTGYTTYALCAASQALLFPVHNRTFGGINKNETVVMWTW